MSEPIKAIETMYRGYRFRSRLEARWAVFFDAAGIKWEYEKEGFDLDGLLYLPDFWLPEQQCWFEIKGEQPTAEEREKAQRLAAKTDSRAVIYVGEIQIPTEMTQDEVMGKSYCLYPFGSYDPADELKVCYFWTECPYCRKLDIALVGDLRDMPCHCFVEAFPHSVHWNDAGSRVVRLPQENDAEYHRVVKQWTDALLDLAISMRATPRLMFAYLAARQARFEFGEQGR